MLHEWQQPDKLDEKHLSDEIQERIEHASRGALRRSELYRRLQIIIDQGRHEEILVIDKGREVPLSAPASKSALFAFQGQLDPLQMPPAEEGEPDSAFRP